jgi:hypothetical protein
LYRKLQPVLKSFLLCRGVSENPASGSKNLDRVLSEFHVKKFPCNIDCVLFLVIGNLRPDHGGQVDLRIQPPGTSVGTMQTTLYPSNDPPADLVDYTEAIPIQMPLEDYGTIEFRLLVRVPEQSPVEFGPFLYPVRMREILNNELPSAS